MSDTPKKGRYPNISDASAAVLVRAEPGEKLTPELVEKALTATAVFPLLPSSFETIRADLDKAHMLDEDGRLTPLADQFGHLLRNWLARQIRS